MSRDGRGPRITTVLVLMVLCVTAAGLTVCMTLFLNHYQRAVGQNARISGEQAVGQVAGVVDVYIQDMSEGAEFLTQALARGEDDAFFDSFLRGRPDVVAAACYDGEGNMLRCWSTGRVPRADILKNLSFDPAWMSGGRERAVSAPHVESLFEGYYPWVVTLTQRLEGEEGEDARFLAMDLSFTRISDSVDRVGIGQHGYCYIMDADGGIVYHPQQQLLYYGLKTEDTASLTGLEDGSYAEEGLMRSITTAPSCAWRIVGVSYQDELVAAQTSDMVRIALWTCLAVLLATGVCALVLSQVLSRPLNSLSGAMKDFERDAGHYVFQPVRGSAEVGELSDDFGHMVLRIQTLMERVRREEVDLRKTELKALQAQINPHFLYNTLDSIAWMCEQDRCADAVKMVHALARLFRISISRGHELIPIAKELEHAESYLQIQKYRYKNQFTYSFDVDPACLDWYCNKITLQPIIENAILHGLDLLVEEGHIDVSVARDGDDVVFRVRDNGVGMSPEQTAFILERDTQDRTGIGIKNVNDRLQIYFGKQYGLRLTSELDVGTCVEIRMPRIEEAERYETK